MIETPVVFVVFRRPEHTRKVFAEIARAQPRHLFVVVDGPRPGHPDDAERCAEVRRIVAQVDWDCQVERIYAEQNMGCGYRVSSGISQVFERVEQAIILEDDTVPQPDFFRFCEELLARYRDDERVMMISGTNPIGPQPRLRASYSFALPTVCWGWATWRRAWSRHYDLPLATWPALREAGLLEQLFEERRAVRYWRERFDRMHRDYGQPQLTTWDYQWFYSIWAQHGLCAFPDVNLVANIGYGADATHTTTEDPSKVHFSTGALTWPLRHPPYMLWDRAADRLRMAQVLHQPPLAWRALMQIYGLVPQQQRARISTARARLLGQQRRGSSEA